MKPTSRPNGEAAVLAKIAAMPAPYRAMGERLHALILRSAPALQPTVWYGMPGYAKDGKTVCFFRADKKYMTFCFTQEANLTREEGAPSARRRAGPLDSARWLWRPATACTLTSNANWNGWGPCATCRPASAGWTPAPTGPSANRGNPLHH